MNEAEIASGLPSTPHYKYAQQVGSQLFLAGQVPQAADGSIVAPGDPCAQASQCLANLNKVLALHGFATPDIRRLVVYVVGEQGDLTAAWCAVTKHFGGQVPPATLLGVARLGYPGQVVEIDATVVKG
ncbi:MULTISPECIES: RidA family protein [unclassified Acidovorax]|uniref:RidA family protein n=1 Tax=unclassified Acidovorax TaxID=2684926 RepID=UPI0009E7C04B|nr:MULTISPECIES: RidA family protein [unclassified Acidovorax]